MKELLTLIEEVVRLGADAELRRNKDGTYKVLIVERSILKAE